MSKTVFCCWVWWLWWLPPEEAPDPTLLAICVGVLLPVEEAFADFVVNCVAKAEGFKVMGELGVLRSRGAWEEGRFGWLRLSTASRNALRDSLSQRAGETEASLYLLEWKYIIE